MVSKTNKPLKTFSPVSIQNGYDLEIVQAIKRTFLPISPKSEDTVTSSNKHLKLTTINSIKVLEFTTLDV